MIASFENGPFQPPVGTRPNWIAKNSTRSDATTYDGAEMPKIAPKVER